MGTAYQPKIVTDGLAFIYDTGSGKSSKGEPTTNLQASGSAGVHSSASGNAVSVTDASAEKGPGWKKVTITARGTNFRTLQFTYTSMAANTMYCHSAVFDWGNMKDKGYLIYFDGNGTGTRAYYRPGDYVNTGSGSINSTMPDGKFAGTITHTSSHNHAFFIRNYSTGVSGLNDFFYYKDYQVEINSHPTQFTAGTRSATQGLIDRTGTSTIDISNASFDSNAQMTFDGTDDYITLGSNSTLQAIGSNATIECWFKSSNTSSKFALMVGWGEGNSYYSSFGIGNWFSAWPDESIHVGVNSAAVVYAERDGSAKYHDGNWHHVVGLIGQNNHKIFVDGSEVSVSFAYGSDSVSTSNIFGFSSGTEVFIGARPYGSGSGHFQGDLPLVKIYDRLLTAAEVLQNFNASRDRFKI